MTPVGGHPLVSIITPVFNGSRYLDELIQSVQQQDYPHVEHIVIDDGSNDDGATVEVLRRYPHLRWWSRANKGQYATLNEGLAAANGEIISIISADDRYLTPSAFSSVIKYWDAHPDVGCVYGRTLRMDSSGLVLPPDPTLRREPFPIWLFRYESILDHCSMFVARSVIDEKSITFDDSLRYCGDWDWIIRLTKATMFGYLDQPLSLYREHAEQTRQVVTRAKLLHEHGIVLRRHGANRALHLLLVYEHRVRKAFWLLRSSGIKGLAAAAKTWTGRR